MILRVYRARIYPGREPDYERFLEEEGVPMMESQPGVVDYWVGRPYGDDSRDYVFVSIWTDLDSLTAVRPNWTDPEILPEERDIIEFAKVHHYQTGTRDRLANRAVGTRP